MLQWLLLVSVFCLPGWKGYTRAPTKLIVYYSMVVVDLPSWGTQWVG